MPKRYGGYGRREWLYAQWEQLPDSGSDQGQGGQDQGGQDQGDQDQGDQGQGGQTETPTDPEQKPTDEQKPVDDQKPEDQQPTGEKPSGQQQPAGEKSDQLAQTSDPTSLAPVAAAGLTGLAAIGAGIAARLRGRRRE